MNFPKVNGGPDGLSIDPTCPMVRFTVNGEQVLENTPVELPLGYRVPEPLEVTIMRMVSQELSKAAAAAGKETLDEAYDFDMDDGDDSYEQHLTPSEIHAMVHAREMKPEYPDGNVRKGTGVSEGKAGDSKVGGSDSDGSGSRGDKAQSKGDGDGAEVSSAKGAGRRDADGGDRKGTGKRSSGVASED